MPIGPARPAEPHAGVEVDLAILAIGFAAAIAPVPLAVPAPPAWRAARRRRARRGAGPRPRPARGPPCWRPARQAGSVAAARACGWRSTPATATPPSRSVGARGHRLAIGAMVAAGVFGTSLLGLVGTPPGYGQNWDASTRVRRRAPQVGDGSGRRTRAVPLRAGGQRGVPRRAHIVPRSASTRSRAAAVAT